MEKLQALQEALANGLRRGALIVEKTGETHPVEVVFAEAGRLLAVTRTDPGALSAETRVRVELPLETAVIFVPGCVASVRRDGDGAELELTCPDGSESRQRRMDVRVDAECRIRLGADGAWEETRTVNVSVGGALVVSSLNARVGERVDVELEIDGILLRGQAEVVRRGVKTHGANARTSAALRFLGLPEPTRENLALFVLRTQAAEKHRHRR